MKRIATRLLAQLPHDREEPVDLSRREGRRRLVHHQHLGVDRQRLRDLDQLLIGDGERADRCFDVDLDAETLQQRLDFTVHLRPIDPAEPVLRLAAHEDVFRDIEIGEERRVLVDDGDAVLARVERAMKHDLAPVHEDRAGVGPVHAGQHFHERALAGAVLADQRVDLAFGHREIDAAQRLHRAELLGDAPQFNHCRER